MQIAQVGPRAHGHRLVAIAELDGPRGQDAACPRAHVQGGLEAGVRAVAGRFALGDDDAGRLESTQLAGDALDRRRLQAVDDTGAGQQVGDPPRLRRRAGVDQRKLHDGGLQVVRSDPQGGHDVQAAPRQAGVAVDPGPVSPVVVDDDALTRLRHVRRRGTGLRDLVPVHRLPRLPRRPRDDAGHLLAGRHQQDLQAGSPRLLDVVAVQGLQQVRAGRPVILDPLQVGVGDAAVRPGDGCAPASHDEGGCKPPRGRLLQLGIVNAEHDPLGVQLLAQVRDAHEGLAGVQPQRRQACRHAVVGDVEAEPGTSLAAEAHALAPVGLVQGLVEVVVGGAVVADVDAEGAEHPFQRLHGLSLGVGPRRSGLRLGAPDPGGALLAPPAPLGAALRAVFVASEPPCRVAQGLGIEAVPGGRLAVGRFLRITHRRRPDGCVSGAMPDRPADGAGPRRAAAGPRDPAPAPRAGRRPPAHSHRTGPAGYR